MDGSVGKTDAGENQITASDLGWPMVLLGYPCGSGLWADLWLREVRNENVNVNYVTFITNVNLRVICMWVKTEAMGVMRFPHENTQWEEESGREP